MFSLPVALVGAFLGLYLTGNTFNIFSLIGMIMLMGLVGKNAILLVDFTDTLRRQGMERTEAILEAGYTRLRPILMTTCDGALRDAAAGAEARGGRRVAGADGGRHHGRRHQLDAADAGAGAGGLHDPGRCQAGRRGDKSRMRRGGRAATTRPIPALQTQLVPPPVQGGAED